MTKEQQDHTWACLPKEVRKEIRTLYQHVSKNPRLDKYDSVYLATLEDVFDKHNLTSDIEPEEMLMVERKSVMAELCRAANLQNDKEEDWIRAGEEIEFTLTQLFGDKCLPDKELEHGLEQTSVQVQPKFKVGDKVVICSKLYDIKWDGIVKTIKSVELNEKGELVYSFYDYNYNVVEDSFPHLIPYTEENKEPMEEIESGKEDNFPTKELNLCYLLNGCEGETFFSYSHGEVKLLRMYQNAIGYNLDFVVETENGKYVVTIYSNGKRFQSGLVDMFPSKELYEEYPLDAYSAWMEWKESRKYVLEVEVSSWLDGEDGRECEVYDGKKWFHFDSKEELEQSKEAIKEVLQKFHEENPEQ